MYDFACIPKSRTNFKWLHIFFFVYSIDGYLSRVSNRSTSETPGLWDKDRLLVKWNRTWWSSPKFFAVFFKTWSSQILTPVECSHISWESISMTNWYKIHYLFYVPETLRNIQRHGTSRVEPVRRLRTLHNQQLASRWYSYLRQYSKLIPNREILDNWHKINHNVGDIKMLSTWLCRQHRLRHQRICDQFFPFCAVIDGSIPSWKHSHLKTIPWPPAAMYVLLTNEKSLMPWNSS